MDRMLVVLNGSEASIRLLNEARIIAEAVDAPILLLALLDSEDNEELITTMWDRVKRNEEGERPATGQEVVKIFADRMGERLLGDSNVDYRSQGEVVTDNSPSARIIEVAESNGCDHLFIPGKRRSPTGKAIFGDIAQSVILNFDGIVTVAAD